MEREIHIRENKNDITPKDFWDILENLLDTTIDILNEKAEEFDFNMNDVDPDENFVEEQRIERLIHSSSDCAMDSKEYIEMVNEWFENPNHKTEGLGIIKDDDFAKKFPLKIIDSVDIIRWYQYQIHVKIMRALSGKNEDEFEDMPRDSDGSAKVALLGIDRSISAWGNFLMNFSDDDNSIFNILLHLVDIQHSVDAKFPEARNFIRPGFDE